ncbi:hypothetical protein IDH44_16305 [Paenibacillus sp. IB182496]|uniref:Secreted protein n=1 Tax=Paenibacillus sabuli TaxID=2772509 RepID=A0A927BW64_9BACL|nr:hypothetical protein [Paenibacillus sabuli]MBD2846760.1 hypothetical protein [Paenibacillus sabuli]
MNRQKRVWLLAAAMVIVVLLAACSGNDNSSGGNETSGTGNTETNASGGGDNAGNTGNTDEEPAEDEPDATETDGNGDGDTTGKLEPDHPVGERPASESFELELEGMKEEKSAELAQGDGYSLYVFDIFAFDAEANKLMMDFNNDYHVEIVRMPADYNTDQLKQDAQQWLSEAGDPSELDAADVHPAIGDVQWAMRASSGELSREVLFKEIGGIGYQFNVNIPVGEANDGFATHAYTMLNTIENETN